MKFPVREERISRFGFPDAGSPSVHGNFSFGNESNEHKGVGSLRIKIEASCFMKWN